MALNKIPEYLLGFKNGFNSQKFIATEGQTLFTLTNGSYKIGQKRLKVYLHGLKQAVDNVIETSSTSFTLDPLSSGTEVEAEFYESVLPSVGGHNANHKKGGVDELKVDDLGNYKELIDDRFGNLFKRVGTTSLDEWESYATKDANGAVTDWIPALRKAVDYITTNFQSGTVIISMRIYPVKTQLVIDLQNWIGSFLCIQGDGLFSVPQGNIPELNTDTFTGINNTSLGGLIRIHTKDDTTQRVHIQKMTFTKPDNADNSRYGTFINVATWRNVKIRDCGFKGGDIQVLIDRSYGCAIEDCYFQMFNQAIWNRSTANTTVIEKNVIRNGRHGIKVDSSIASETTIGVRIEHNYFETLSNEAIAFYGVRFSTIEDNYFEACDISGSTFSSITGDTTLKVSIYLDKGTGSNVEASVRNVIKGNATGSTLQILMSNGGAGANLIIGDSLQVLDKNATKNNTILDTNGNLKLASLDERSAGAGINVNGKGINMESVITPSFLNGWVNGSIEAENIGYWKDPYGFVHLEGTIKSGSMNLSAFTLPLGYRPRHEMKLAVNSNDAFGQLRITTAGDVIPRLGSNVDFELSGVSFRAYGR